MAVSSIQISIQLGYKVFLKQQTMDNFRTTFLH
jgi:hypothetical protein